MPISVAIITPTLKDFGTIFCIMMFITVIGNSRSFPSSSSIPAKDMLCF